MDGRQLVMAGVKEVGQHAVKIEIDEVRRVIEQIIAIFEHDFERRQQAGEVFEQLRRLRAPLIDTAATKLAFFMADEAELVGFGDEFLVENVVQFETDTFDFVFNVAPKDSFGAGPEMRKEPEIKFFVEIFGDDLGIVAGFEHDRFAVTNDGHAVIAFAGQFPDQSAIMIRNVRDLEGNPAEFQDAFLDEAERAPGNLDEFNHFASM